MPKGDRQIWTYDIDAKVDPGFRRRDGVPAPETLAHDIIEFNLQATALARIAYLYREERAIAKRNNRFLGEATALV